MGTIRQRPFDDPRNTRTVDNSDPKAHNKLYAGIPGTHLEQRCCNDRPPQRLPQLTGWYVDLNGNRVCNIIEYWSRPENRAGARDGWWNASTPPGMSVEMANTGTLTCAGCEGDLWDQFVESLEFTLNEMLPVIEGIALAASYFPVVGTAVSFVLDSAVSLAKGGDLDDAVLDAIGDALPGQPVSGAAYRVTRTILRDGSIDEVAISALPVTDDVRSAIGSSVQIALAVAHGEYITDVALAEIYQALPETGRRGADVARRIIAGENVTEIVVSEATLAAAELARQQGDAAVNRFIAQSGFQSAVETIDPALQAALRTGIGVGHAQHKPFTGVFDFSEKHTHRNDALAAKGRVIIDSGATWQGRPLRDIRAGASFTFTRKAPDPLTHIEEMRTAIHHINDGWRRGFDVAIGLCDGLEEDSEDQQLVLLSLNALNAQQGFEAGQYIQHSRTAGDWRDLLLGEFDPERSEIRVAGHRVQALLGVLNDARSGELNVERDEVRVAGRGVQALLKELNDTKRSGGFDVNRVEGRQIPPIKDEIKVAKRHGWDIARWLRRPP